MVSQGKALENPVSICQVQTKPFTAAGLLRWVTLGEKIYIFACVERGGVVKETGGNL